VSAFLKEAPDYAFADSSRAAGNYGNLILQPELFAKLLLTTDY
jgi:hypothetical protein